MADVIEYIGSKGFNKNIYINHKENGDENFDISKFGMEFFPGNEIMNPGAPSGDVAVVGTGRVGEVVVG